MRVAAVTMETCLLFFCACADNMWHCCSSIKWVDQGVVYLFIHLFGLLLEPRCPDNRGSTVLSLLVVQSGTLKDQDYHFNCILLS